MARLKKHHTLILALSIVFLTAWAVWTFIMLPRSEAPNLPDPGAPIGESQ